METDQNSEIKGRREVASRNTKWANSFARWLTNVGVTPNQISIMSAVFSAIGGGFMLSSLLDNHLPLFLIFIIYLLCIQLRLLCNLFDGMVAVEGGKKSIVGDLYNDIPDRFSDIFLIVPLGYVAQGCGVELAWIATALAVLTAYFRWIGAYKTGEHFFSGPMAKQHRMALLTLTAAIGVFTTQHEYYKYVFIVSLIIMNLGLIATLIRRLQFIAKAIHKNSEK